MAFLAFIFGLAIGSFLNVLIARLPKKESILGYSRCPKCQKRISRSENIPVLSFIFLRGRCSKCGSKISWQYPLVELLTAFLFLVSFLVYRGNPVFLIYVLFLISLLIITAFVDLRHFIILDSLVLTGFLVSLFYLLPATSYQLPPVVEQNSLRGAAATNIYGLLFLAGVFSFLFLITKGRGLGFGDVKLAGLLGFIFGLKGAVNIFSLTFLIGFIIAIILLVFKKADLKSKVPLGSIMAGASILFLLSGLDLLNFIDYELILRIYR